MTFLIRYIQKDPCCTSQILLDGTLISESSLLKRRREAELEIYPCQSRCCTRKASTAIYFPRPLKLHILLSLQSSFILSLSSGDKLFSTTEEVLHPTAITSLKGGLVSCTVSLAKGACSLSVTLSTDEGLYKRVYLKPEWNLPETSLPISVLQDPYMFVNKRRINNAQSYQRSRQTRWICEDLSDYTAITGQAGPISFDDRNPEKPGLTGAYCWNGLRVGQTVRVSKLKFWFTHENISGFQATYIVNGIQKIGPRHRCDIEQPVHYPRIFELREGENVSCVQTFRRSGNPISPIHHLSVVTDRGRCFSVGTEISLAKSTPVTLLRHPNTNVVGFRGTIERGLIAFGFVLEFDEIVATGLAEGYKCYVCGVLCSYFTDMKLFQAHVDDCVSSLVASQQVLLRPKANV